MDNPVAQLIFAIIPGLVWLSWIRRQDRNPECPRLLLRVSLLGCLAAFLVVWVRPRLEASIPLEWTWGSACFDAFVVTALIEELIKGGAIVAAALHRRRMDEPSDGFVFGVAVGLGFATVENVFYVMETGDAFVVVVRSFTAMIIHVGCSGLLGHALGRARLDVSQARVVLVFIEVVLLHGIYDLFLFAYPTWRLVSLLVVLPLLLAIFSFHLRRANVPIPRTLENLRLKRFRRTSRRRGAASNP